MFSVNFNFILGLLTFHNCKQTGSPSGCFSLHWKWRGVVASVLLIPLQYSPCITMLFFAFQYGECTLYSTSRIDCRNTIPHALTNHKNARVSYWHSHRYANVWKHKINRLADHWKHKTQKVVLFVSARGVTFRCMVVHLPDPSNVINFSVLMDRWIQVFRLNRTKKSASFIKYVC